MKKLNVFFLIVILAFALCGCMDTKTVQSPAAESRFIIVERTMCWEVVYDRETLVMYAVSWGSHNSGTFTPLYDTDGSPLLWKGEKD